jgi:hypothetical protein
MNLDEADKLARSSTYGEEATHQDTNPVNWGDAAGFFIAGYDHAMKVIADKLQDPQVVHISMLRESIAKLNVGQLRHLYPELSIKETP